MTSMIATKRLYLRQWQASDRARFAEMNADPKVMAYFPKLLTPALSNTIANKCQKLIEEHGWGFWVVARKDSADKSDDFIGMVGLNNVHANMPFAPAVEIAWRLHRDYWGLGYATEAALAALRYAFEVLELSEVVAFTAVINKRSQKLMQRLGMTDTQDNFYHPMLDADHRLAEHVLYKITRQEWQALIV